MEKTELKAQLKSKMKPVDGFRALVHVSLIALHCAMLTTGHLPSTGEAWGSFKKNILYTSFQAGGIQVDLMFMLSGFLLVKKILAQRNAEFSVVSIAVDRAKRLLPTIIVVCLIAYTIGDTWDVDKDLPGYVPAWTRISTACSLVLNYFDQGKYGSFSLSLMWSCCVDYHSQIIITLIAYLNRWAIGEKKDTEASRTKFASFLKYSFIVWLLISFATRAYLFDEVNLNIFKLGQISHFGLLMTSDSFKWIEQLGHTWLTKQDPSAQLYSGNYLLQMYCPTHTRYGPFAVGGILACNLFFAESGNRGGNNESARQSNIYFTFILKWLFTIWSIVTLIIPCLPATDDVPVEGQFIATAGLRIFASIAGSFLLYRSLVPEDHDWHWKLLSSILSLSIFKPIAMLSFCSYLVHFRVILELNFRPELKEKIFDFMSYMPFYQNFSRDSAECWIQYIPALFVCTFIFSMGVASILHLLVEKPINIFFRASFQKTCSKNA